MLVALVKNIDLDKEYLIGRINECTSLRFLREVNPAQKCLDIVAYDESRKVLHFLELPVKNRQEQRALVIRRWGSYPSDELLFEILTMIEDKEVLLKNYSKGKGPKFYDKFVIYYKS